MEEKVSKVQQWFKDNISTIAIAIICLVYIFYGIVTITESGKTIIQIVADGIISFIMGFLIKSLFNAQGIASGEKAKKFLKTKELYVDILEKISPFQQYLSSYCDLINENTIKKNQIAILRSVGLEYEDFKNKRYDLKALSKKERKAIKKAMNIKIHYINDAILLSDYQLSMDVGKDIAVNKKKYLRESNGKTFIIMIASAFLFGYFSIDPNKGFDYRGMIWSLIQVATYLGIGAMQFFNGYNFIADTYRTAVIRKTNYLENFNNMYKADPSQFHAVKPKLKVEQEQAQEPKNHTQKEEKTNVGEITGLKEENKELSKDIKPQEEPKEQYMTFEELIKQEEAKKNEKSRS